MKKISQIFFLMVLFFGGSEVSSIEVIKVYPRIISLNNDGVNDKFFVKYFNDEGKELVLKVYDVSGVLVGEKKVSGSVEEDAMADGSFVVELSLEDIEGKIGCGSYVFVLVSERKVVSKGSFVVVK